MSDAEQEAHVNEFKRLWDEAMAKYIEELAKYKDDVAKYNSEKAHGVNMPEPVKPTWPNHVEIDIQAEKNVEAKGTGGTRRRHRKHRSTRRRHRKHRSTRRH